MQIAIDDLHLDHLFVVTPKGESYKLAANVSSVGLSDIVSTPQP